MSHGHIVVLKDGIDGKWPRMPSLNAKHILERDGFLVTLAHSVGCLFLQAVNGSNARHETVADIHEHTRGEQKCSYAQHGHDTDQMDDNRMEGAYLIRTQKVIPSKQDQGIGRTGPSVHEKEQKMLCGTLEER